MRGAGAGEKEVKIAALETSDCWMKPMCSLYPDLCKTLPKDFDLSGFREALLSRNIFRVFLHSVALTCISPLMIARVLLPGLSVV